MTSDILPPVSSFGLISGTAFTSASPAVLAKILDSLDLASLEHEHARLQLAIKQLEQSNKEISEFIELEQQELAEHLQEQGHPFQPDPEFMLAIEENEAIIAKYNKTCADLMSAIQKKRESGQVETAASHETLQAEETTGGIYL
ncbi:hypothetical protein BGZ49_006499 [Haplosporangium sp. Z 27]|nr:hypothetical protein BGZ49_006499 [Haplosporangium sp. Z 27]